MKTLAIDSLDDLPDAAEAVIDALAGRTVVAFRGEMGAGKTTLIGAILDRLGSADTVTSPTFALVNQYDTADAATAVVELHRNHFIIRSLCHAFQNDQRAVDFVQA